jgi:hypothetical protein
LPAVDDPDVSPAPPQPANWVKGRYPAILTGTTVVIAILAVLAVFVAVPSLFSSELEVAIPVAGIALWLVHFAGFFWHVRWPPRRPVGNAAPSTDGTTRGVRFRYSRRTYYWFSAFLVVMLLLELAFAVAVATFGGAVGIGFAVLVGAGTLLLGWFLVVALRHAPG